LPVLPIGIPEELKARPQWVNWKYAWDGKKWTKHPYNPGNGRKASSTELLTWSPFEDVLAAYETGKYDGVGFVFSSGDAYTGVDLDGCRDPENGEVARWAIRVIKGLGGYSETSPSGGGMHVIVRGELSEGVRHKVRGPAGGTIEAYSTKRFFTVTGMPL
jgi:putative DNA primase/helicase